MIRIEMTGAAAILEFYGIHDFIVISYIENAFRIKS